MIFLALIFLKLAKNSLKLETPLALLVRYSAGGPFCCYFFGWEDYVPELWEIGLDPAVQGVPVKKKRSVNELATTYTMKMIHSCGLQLSYILDHAELTCHAPKFF